MSTFTITSTSDTAGDTSTGTTSVVTNPDGTTTTLHQGTLRQAINFANLNVASPSTSTTIGVQLAPGTAPTITLAGDLPLVATSIQLDGTDATSGTALTLDGASTYRGFLVSGIAANGTAAAATSVGLANLTIQNVTATGGAGGPGGGGGGLGAGGAIFVGPAANVTLTNVSFADAQAVGGAGTASTADGAGGGGGLGGAGGTALSMNGNGGGGLFFDGGNTASLPPSEGADGGGGGGGGSTAAGASATQPNGGAGGAGLDGLGGGGGGGKGFRSGGAGGTAGGTGAQSGNSSAYPEGGVGGFGGGGGGSGSDIDSGESDVTSAGGGGFGGGGGGDRVILNFFGFGGDGGFGGGGGAGFAGGLGGFGGGGGGGIVDANSNSIGIPSVFAGGTGAGSIAGGASGGGGGGGALGGAIFVASGGTLLITGTSSEGDGTVTSGMGASGGGNGSPFGAGIFYQGTSGSAGASTLTFGAGDRSYADAIADQNGSGGSQSLNGLGGTGGVTALAKAGTGTLTLAGASTYTGGTTIQVGTVDLAAADTFDASGAVTSGAAGTGAITFAATTSEVTLALEAVAQPTSPITPFGNALNAFGAGDVLDLRGLSDGQAIYANGTLTVTGLDATGVVPTPRVEMFTLTNPGSTAFTTVSDGAGGTDVVVVCFAAGTAIRVWRDGARDVAVERLAIGDLAVTASGALRPIRWLGQRTIDCTTHPTPSDVWPVRIRAGAFGIGACGGDLPERDLELSPGHPVLVGSGSNEVLVPIMCLINGTSVRRVPVQTVTYWHVELDAHDILLAEGLPAESYLDWGDRAFFTEGSNHALHNPDVVVPGLAGRCRPVAFDGPVVENERRRLDTMFAMNLVAQCAWPAEDGARCAAFRGWN